MPNFSTQVMKSIAPASIALNAPINDALSREALALRPWPEDHTSIGQNANGQEPGHQHLSALYGALRAQKATEGRRG
eukprot:8496607-Pyramimonas_sp.AAC.1